MHFSEKVKPFNCCPACGASNIVFGDNKEFYCRECAFIYFHNAAAAVAVILEYGEKVLLIKRAREPGKGKLDLPGGFVDPNESAEDAVIREIKEELKIDLREPKYLGSCPNIYKYEGVIYYTCDLFFHCKIDAMPTDFDKKEIEDLILINPLEIAEEKIAFSSTIIGLGILNSLKSRNRPEAR